ncbi:MAG: hypothetical protein LUD46_03305 [Parabacteroides sp.]|nr:hypothetical protein [Parabacteroides sp.]
MTHKLFIRDLTLRDGQQSSLSARMAQEQIDRLLPFYREAGGLCPRGMGRRHPRRRDALSRRRPLGTGGEDKGGFGR